MITKINNFEFLGDSEEEDDPNYQEASSGEEESSKDDENNARIQESEEKKPTKRDRTRTKQANCPECGIVMHLDSISRHLRRQHSNSKAYQEYLENKGQGVNYPWFVGEDLRRKKRVTNLSNSSTEEE